LDSHFASFALAISGSAAKSLDYAGCLKHIFHATRIAGITVGHAQLAVFPAIGIAENQTAFSICLLKAKNTYHPTR
jgi:hypothetical protein